MHWNWQQSDWPDFRWNQSRLAEAEQQFLLGGGVLVGTVSHLASEEIDRLTIEAMSTEALTTSEIEGELLDRASVQSSIQKQLGLTTVNRRVRPAEQGIAEMMVNLYRTASEPLSKEMLFAWHRMVTNGRHDLKDVGCYRTGEEPMQVVSGRIDTPKVHFEAPPARLLSKEMNRFITWFNSTGSSSATRLTALARAGIAHLYFESIHPFEDGNGRIGRALAEKSLAQSLGRPTLIQLSTTILAKRSNYYKALELASQKNEITDWLAWFAGITIEAQRRTQALIEFVLDTTKLLDRLDSQLNKRQVKALLRVLQEGPSGFKGGLSASNYVKITGASPATATRDLADLIQKGAVIRTGELRHARYHANIRLSPVKHVTINDNGQLVES
jgi:Fic family protein